ncbi:hypothetical protein [Nostoc sp.]|uniref:hypothetical protein n=1 Tax=Nostoc sp. TaxID=1180 RepID=UPI002FFBF00D
MIFEKIRRGASRVGGFADLSVSNAGASLALFYWREFGTKSLRMVRYGFHPNAAYWRGKAKMLQKNCRLGSHCVARVPRVVASGVGGFA